MSNILNEIASAAMANSASPFPNRELELRYSAMVAVGIITAIQTRELFCECGKLLMSVNTQFPGHWVEMECKFTLNEWTEEIDKCNKLLSEGDTQRGWTSLAWERACVLGEAKPVI